jgi:hypothetical protein
LVGAAQCLKRILVRRFHAGTSLRDNAYVNGARRAAQTITCRIKQKSLAHVHISDAITSQIADPDEKITAAIGAQKTVSPSIVPRYDSADISSLGHEHGAARQSRA